MKCEQLLAELKYEFVNKTEGVTDREITAVVNDTRKVSDGCLFVCIKGANFDSHDAVADIAKNGAAVIVVERDVEPVSGASVIKVDDTRIAMSLLAAAWFDYPARKLTTIALTGTKGKSTSAYMIRNILQKCGHKTGIIGTIGVGIGDKVYQTHNTTPDPYTVQSYLAQMVDEGCDSLVMEVSSQAMKQNRVAGIIYDYALFTNLESDHIGPNEHASFEEYTYCKSLLFRQCRAAFGNGDDPHFDAVVRCKEPAPADFPKCDLPACDNVMSFGYGENCDFRAENIELIGSGGDIGIAYEAVFGGERLRITLSTPGRFNVNNSLGAFAVCSGILKKDAAGDASKLNELYKKAAEALYETKVRGRLETLKISDRFAIMIDYAHNSMALKSLLTTLREHKPGRLVCLFGCGGNRDKERRFEMGEVSSRLSDLTVVTSDNPRFEKPLDIINDILIGVKKADGEYIVIPDRKEAIYTVIRDAHDGDMIILAGKGQEDYQEIEGVRYHMDERELVAEAVERIMAERGYV
ncbi:MAG: UDP-N-acetylmuramoyl-L-alanyl-D-glutamate--2,6-diaminopimelate ligase [Lachnospiraceae bacterium]|nr:UDP-N-acetylmuramoyl-L-alanyl-D-glutamate--2,6-diaminopimelate ligase [Lachnospiraceae bacterium]